MARLIVTSLVLGFLLVWSACADRGTVDTNRQSVPTATLSPTPTTMPGGGFSSPEKGDTSPQQFEGTAGIVEKRRDSEVAILGEVLTGRHEQFDRIVFEFANSAPGYHIEYVDRPVRSCGSGEVVELSGDGYLLIRLTPARAHTEEGNPTIAERERTLNLTILKQAKLICDFEAQVEWALGLSSPNRYRVLELQNPSRLVVDIKH
ncbi:MAG TPA: hypothetical protein VJ023_20010 [Pyrinomonadaceae bacterium]|nr:hypothetical protein [Pyrinomonadaceae bacterium]